MGKNQFHQLFLHQITKINILKITQKQRQQSVELTHS